MKTINNSKNFKQYCEIINDIGNDKPKSKCFEFNGVCIESPITDESTRAWFTYEEACKYYGAEKLKEVWTEEELRQMPWNDIK